MSKVLKGSFTILLGTIVFRMGGYLYRVLMQYLLGVSGYGILSLVIPLQNVLILVAAAGLPPAIAKYVSENLAKNDKHMVRQVITTSSKIMLIMSIIFALAIFFLAKPLAPLLNWKAEVVILFQIIGLITPFSILLGIMRGVFQGYQNMGYLLITKAAEQISVIIFATILILLGFYVLGAVIGSIIGFATAAIFSLILFREKIWKDLNNVETPTKAMNEKQLAKKLLIFSFPVVIAGLAELTLFDTGTYIINIFMNETFVGYYNIISPVARLPLILSLSIATALLPAASEALSLNDHHLVERYVTKAFRYLILILLPLCIGVLIFASPLLSLLFPKAPLTYEVAGSALIILIFGMGFFSVYSVASSIFQGIGKPYPPMFYLVIGSLLNLILNIILIPELGLNGAAIATATACFMVMFLSVSKILKLTKAKLPIVNIVKIVASSILIGLIMFILPKTIPWLIVTIFVMPFIYLIILAVLGALEKTDLSILERIGGRLGPFSNHFMKILEFCARFVK